MTSKVKRELTYLIQLTILTSQKSEIAVVSLFSNNVQYQLLKLHSVMDPISDTKKMIPSGTYASREFNTLHARRDG